MRLSLGYQVLIAALFGLFCGLVFGPLCKVIQPVGEVYVMLLQMVALPYICFSLIHGLGSITPGMGKKLFLRGWPFWLTLWVIVFAIIFLVSQLIPKPMTAFISNISIERDPELAKNFLKYLVPENPIYDLANNIVPAIAVFGLIVGCALMHLAHKDPLLAILARSNETIEKIFKWLAILSPIGVFAHIAVVTGTVYFQELYALEFYVVCFILISLFVTVWILPVILSILTPITYTQALSAFKFVCLLPFATALPTIAFPFINMYMKKLGQQHANGDPNFHATSQTVMPICFSFGQIGNCLILFFILFLSFYFRHPFVGSEKGLLTLLVAPLSLGSSVTSINAVYFLIDWLNFPSESKALFTQTMAVTLNFQVLMSIASVLTFIILVLYAYYGLLQLKWKMFFTRLVPAFAVLIAVVIGAKQVIHLRDNYQDLYPNLTIQEAIHNPVSAKILARGESGAMRDHREDRPYDPLEDILKTGVLKVGYGPDNMPYAYFNNDHQLVGMDIGYAYQLARDLDCTLEFVLIDIDQMGADLSNGVYDIGMSAVLMNEERIRYMDFTHTYTEQDNVLIVPIKNRSQYIHLKQIAQDSSLRIGAIGGYIPVVERHFPLAKVVAATGIEEAFQQGKADAYMTSRIPAFVWSLSHPEYVVADYEGLIGKRYFAYPIPIGSIDWGSFLNHWLVLKEQSGFKEKMSRYWIEGENPKQRPPRWSLLHQILDWIH